MKKIDLEVKCPECKGTGLYVGMAECNGAAVICCKCKGTGKYRFKYEYEEFKKREIRNDVERVYRSGYGYKISTGTIIFSNGIGPVDMSKEGISYKEFLSGKTPCHTRLIACPLRADQQSCHNIQGFTEECDRLHGGTLVGLRITQCKYQKNMAECWKRFDKQSRNV